MKKIFSWLMLLLPLLMLSSCAEEEEAFYDENFLYGKWESGTLYYKYMSDHTGATWDLADDITEEEAMQFTWTLVKDELTHIYVTELSTSTKASIPKVYTVVTLTEDRLVYEDDYGKMYSFTKIEL